MAPDHQKPGLKSGSFWALMVTQFLGVANDNAFRFTILFLVLETVKGGPAREAPYVSAVGAVFVVPFLVFSTYAGALADRVSKRSVIYWSKVAEAAVMGAGALALLSGRLSVCLIVLFLMGAQSTFFSPAKYGILPEMLPGEELSRGNGIIRMLTDAAIIVGTITGGFLFDLFRGGLWRVGAVYFALASVGTLTALLVGHVPPASPGCKPRWNFLAEVWERLTETRRDRALFVALLALSFFWVVGAIFHLNFPVYADHLLQLGRSETSLLLALTAVGIGIGGLLSGWLSGRKVELGFVPAGALLMAVFSLDLWVGSPSVARAMVDVVMLGVGGGFYLIPLAAFVQKRAPRDRKGMTMAIANFLSFGGMLLAAGLYFVAGRAGPAAMFGLLAIISVAAIGSLSVAMPEFPLRMLLWPYSKLSCRLRLRHPERVPLRGGALLAAPRLSFRDGLRMVAGLGRYVRLAAIRPASEARSPGPCPRLWRGIAVRADEPEAGLERVRKAVAEGEVVCLCGGAVDEDAFRDCLDDATEGLEAPAIPLTVRSRETGLRRWLLVRFGQPD